MLCNVFKYKIVSLFICACSCRKGCRIIKKNKIKGYSNNKERLSFYMWCKLQYFSFSSFCLFLLFHQLLNFLPLYESIFISLLFVVKFSCLNFHIRIPKRNQKNFPKIEGWHLGVIKFDGLKFGPIR